MQIAGYYKMRRAIQENAPGPDESTTSALEVDLRGALLATGLFHTVEVGRTDSADRHVIAMCGFVPEIDSAEAALALARLWSKQIAVGFWQANTMRVDKGHVELQGATRTSLEGPYVTVHLLAQAAPAPAPIVEQSLRVGQLLSIGMRWSGGIVGTSSDAGDSSGTGHAVA